MKKLTIKNIGPIEHVELDLKQVNVIIGPQGSGKSCILKVASFCSWVEKKVLLNGSNNVLINNEFIKKELIGFHKLEGFITEDSYFYYESDYMTLEFEGEFCHYELKEDEQWNYKLSRVSYIPAERNIISVVSNIFEINFGNDYVKNFVKDWNTARKHFTSNAPLSIVDLPISYHYDDSQQKDIVDVGNEKSIRLTNASSGIQSLVPMCSYLDYLFEKQYSAEAMSSAAEDSRNHKLAINLYHSKYDFSSEKATFGFVGELGTIPFVFKNRKSFEECSQIFKNFTQVDHSDIYLEEPELNIFPKTQIQLVNYLIEKIKLHGDNLFLATHSHYILYALNNCMLGYKVAENVKEAEDEDILKGEKSWIDPNLVGVWELRDGKLNPVQESPTNTIQDEDGLIRGNYFDRVMHNVMADFTNLMNYYE